MFDYHSNILRALVASCSLIPQHNDCGWDATTRRSRVEWLLRGAFKRSKSPPQTHAGELEGGERRGRQVCPFLPHDWHTGS